MLSYSIAPFLTLNGKSQFDKARAKAFTTVKFTKKNCKCFSVSQPESAKAFTNPIQHLQNFVNALAFSGLETLKHLQNFVSAGCIL